MATTLQADDELDRCEYGDQWVSEENDHLMYDMDPI